MSLVIQGIVFVGGSVLVAILGMALVRRWVAHSSLADHTEVAGFVYATGGVIYAVILAFIVIAVWEQFDHARGVADAESDGLAVLSRLANGFPASARQQVQQAAIEYAASVVDEEWPAMAREEVPAPGTVAALNHLYQVYTRPEVATTVDPAHYAESLRQLGVVTAERRERLLNSRGGLPSVLWVTLVAVSILTVGYPLFFGANRALAHAAIVSTLTIEVSLFVFVIYVLASPFHGDVYVAPEGMELFLRQFPSAAAIGTPTP